MEPVLMFQWHFESLKLSYSKTMELVCPVTFQVRFFFFLFLFSIKKKNKWPPRLNVSNCLLLRQMHETCPKRQPSHLPQPLHLINKSGDNKEVSCSVWLRLWLQRAHSSTPADLNNDEELEYSGSVVRGSSSAYSLFSSVFPTARKEEARFTLLKREGNDLVKQGNFEAALHKYSECLALKPKECALYTNRCGAFKDACVLIPNTGRSV